MTETKVTETIRGLVVKNDQYMPTLLQHRSRSAQQMAREKGPIKAIGKNQINVAKKKGNFIHTESGVYKKIQRNRFIELMMKVHTGHYAILIDSPEYDVFHLIGKHLLNMKENNETIPDIKIVCINNDAVHNCEVPDKDDVLYSQVGLTRYTADLYEFIESISGKIGLIWIDSMSGYTTRYRNQCSSTKECIELMCQKKLYSDTIIMWNANHARLNINPRNGVYDDRNEKHFIQLCADLTTFQYVASSTYTAKELNINLDKISESCKDYLIYHPIVDLTEDKSIKWILYFDDNLHTVAFYKYKDGGKAQNMIYHEFIVRDTNSFLA